MGEATGTIEELAENINCFFVNLSSDFQPLEDDPNYQDMLDCSLICSLTRIKRIVP